MVLSRVRLFPGSRQNHVIQVCFKGIRAAPLKTPLWLLTLKSAPWKPYIIPISPEQRCKTKRSSLTDSMSQQKPLRWMEEICMTYRTHRMIELSGYKVAIRSASVSFHISFRVQVSLAAFRERRYMEVGR